MTPQQFVELAKLVRVGLSVIHLVDPENPDTWIIAFNNRASSEASRTDVERLRGQRFLEAFPAIRGTPFIEWYQRVHATGEEMELPEITYGDANVPEAAFRVWLSPLRENSVLGQYVNVTEQRRAETKLRRLNAELEAEVATRTEELRRSRRQLQEVAYAAAHDLQSPIQAVLALTELLQVSTSKEESIRRAMEAHEAAGALRTRLQALLTYTALAPERRPERFSARVVIHAALEALPPWPAGTGMRVDVAVDELLMNRHDFEVIVTQLAANALIYTPPGKAPDVRIRVDAHRGDAILSVCDRGIGIAPQHQREIFQAFRRLHRDVDYPGTGVGLALCRVAVESCGGTIEVDSDVGRGSTFTVSLPGVIADAT